MSFIFMNKIYINVISVSALTIFLTGCGGGGSSGSNTQADPAPTPVVVTPAPDIDLTPTVTGLDPITVYPNVINTLNANIWKDNGFDGSGVKVAVLDSGWTTNSELSNTQIHSNQTYEVVSNQLVHTGSTQTINNVTTHGREMATIIGGQNYGISPGVTLYNGFVGDGVNATASTYNVAGAVNWAVNSMNADIINFSYQSYSLSKLTDPFVSNQLKTSYNLGFNALDSQNRLIIAAAGNNNENVSNEIANEQLMGYTHLVDDVSTKNNILIAGALEEDNSVANYSGYAGANTNVQDRMLFALGVVETPAGFVVGTSTATAVLSGVASMMKQRWSHLGGTEISQIMIDTADKSFTGYDRAVHGQGKLDANAAFSPVGSVATSLTNVDSVTSAPQSISLIMPTGVKTTSSVNYAAFDSYGRDFMYKANTANMSTTNVYDAMAAFTGVRTVEKDGTVMTVANGFANADVKISDGLSIQSSMSSRGQERFNGLGFMGLSNFSTTAGLDSMYTTGMSNKLSQNESMAYGLMYGERQSSDGIKQANGVYMAYKNGGLSVSWNALNNPQSFSGTSMLATDSSMLMSLDTRYQTNGMFIGAKMDSLTGSGASMLRSVNLNTTTAYAGFVTALSDVWSFGAAMAYKESSGNMDMLLPIGRTLDGSVLTQDTSVGLAGSDKILSTSLTANFGDTKVVTQGMASERDKGLMVGVVKTF